jgi:NAD(P)-dependent dehydrogenase (short-subunit alcohol dehydrogenase family)
VTLPVAVVTGATGGIGKHVAFGLAKAGHHVILVGRDAGRSDAARDWIKAQARDASLEIQLTDLSSLAATRALAQTILARHPAISILVNNAGVFTTRREVTPEGHERVLAVNHLSPFVLSHELLPGLKAADKARIITVGSDTSDRAKIDPDNLELKHGWNFVSAYSRAKLAQMMTTFTLAERVAGAGVAANVVHPGAVATNLIRARGAIGIAWKLMAPFLLTEAQGAETPLYAALAPQLATTSGLYFKKRASVEPNKLALDKALREAVWVETERLTAANS